jgi:hypothetical protein
VTVDVRLSNRRYRADVTRPISLGIRQGFDSRQVNHFGAARAHREPIRMGNFIGSTAQGGSCNVDSVTIIPHCNGTHVEHVGHIVDDVAGFPLMTMPPLVAGVVVTVAPETYHPSLNETYRPALQSGDRVILASRLKESFDRWSGGEDVSALIVRTLPNDEGKLSRQYGAANAPPFFTVEATEWINRLPIEHLLVDFPSLDRMHDDGLLTNHHLFWNVPETTHCIRDGARLTRSITELIFVPDSVADGFYLLNLQFPDWASDAVPARPVLFPLTAYDDHEERRS